MYNYIGILHKSSAVSHAIRCNFLNTPSKLNLILAKSSIIEIYNITKNGLESTPYLNIYGNIILLEAIPNQTNKGQDNLFILTEDLDYSIISSKNGQTINLVKGSIKEDIGKKQDSVLSAMSANKEIMVISAYKNLFKIINLHPQNNRMKNFTVRYDYNELLFLSPWDFGTSSDNKEIFNFSVIKSTLINTNNDTTIRTGYSNINNQTNTTSTISFETFQINVNSIEIIPYQAQKTKPGNSQIGRQNGELFFHDLSSNPTISLMIAIHTGIVIIFFSNYVACYKAANGKLVELGNKISYTDRKFITYCLIDDKKNKYFAIDEKGNLFFVAVKNDDELILQFLGEVNYASCLTYLDANYLFVASEKGNSQLIKVLNSPKQNDLKCPFIEIIEEYESLAPISDFSVINNSKEENSIEILTLSGADKSSSIKNIRKGTSLIFDGEISISGITTVNKISYYDQNKMEVEGSDDSITTLIISSSFEQTFIMDITGVYKLTKNTKLSFSNKEKCIYATNILENKILIITNKKITLYNEYFKNINETSLESSPLIGKYHNKTRTIFIYNNNKELIGFEVNEKLLTLKKKEIMLSNVEISSFDVNSHFIVYSLWNSNEIYVQTRSNKTKSILCSIDENGEDIHIPSIQIIKKDNIKFIFISLSNGKMIYYKLKPQFRSPCNYTYTPEDFVFKRKYNISTESFEIKKSKNLIDKSSCLFISAVVPSFIYLNKENPVISNFNIINCKDIINISSTSNVYAFIFNDHISFGSLSSTQTQNVLTKRYENKIYNLTQISMGKNIPFIAMIIEEKNKANFIFCDLNINEISRFKVENDNEFCCTFCEYFGLPERKLIVLGTAISENISVEPTFGHLILLEINKENYKISKLCETETKGGVFKLAIDEKGNIFVAIASTLTIYQLCDNNNIFEFKQIRKCTDFALINDLSFFNSFLLVSEVYRSISLFSYDSEKERLNEFCRDYNPVWIYSTAQCNENMLYCSDIDGNLISLKKELYPKSDEEKYKMERKAIFNYGERINKMIPTKLRGKDLKNIAITEGENDEVNIVYFGTLEGSIGVIIQLTKEIFELLNMLQSHILKKILPNGNFEYEKWRSFKDGFVTEPCTGFVEGNILAEFLNFDNEYRKGFLKEMNYPWQKSTSEIINIIETLLKYH